MYKRIITPLLLAIVLVLVSTSAFAWWNATWTKRYPVNATELGGYTRTYDPALINISSVLCSDADKLDARFADTTDHEIPSYVTSDGLLVVPYLNITANTNTLIGYVYCDASGIGRATTNGGLELINYSAGSAMTAFNVTLTNYGTGFGFATVWATLKSNESIDWTGFKINNSAWQTASKMIFGLESTETVPANGTCAIVDNSNVYIKVKCTPTNNVDYNFNYYMEFFDNSQMFHKYVGEYVTSIKKFGFGTMTSLLGSNDPRAKYSSSASAFTEADGGTPSSGTLSRGIFAFYATATPKWSMITVYNESKISSITTWQSYLRTSSNDPQGCLAGNSYNCNTPQLNISQMTRDANMWLGFVWGGTDAIFNQTYAEKIYPVSYAVGALMSEDVPVLNVSVVPISPTPSDMIFCNVTAIGKNSTMLIRWAWYNGTTLFSNGTKAVANNTPTIVSNVSGDSTDISETWKCGVSGTIDEVSYSAEVFASVVIKGLMFNFSQPTDLNIFNLLPVVYYNTTYTYYTSDGYANNTIVLYAKTNTSTSDISYSYNGTDVKGYYKVGWSLNNSNNYMFRLSENGVYRGTYNKLTDAITTHEVITFGASNERIAQQLLNISNSTPYNVLEFMINSTTGSSASLVVRFCNQSFQIANGQDAVGNANCGICGNMQPNIGYGHTHSVNSKHNNITIPINTSNGYICGVKGTSNGTFVFSSTNPNSWEAFYTVGYVRLGSWGYTGSSGSTWVIGDATLDMHLHQYTNDSTHYEYACYNDTGGQQCSAVRSDLIDMIPQPPISPVVYSPINTTYNGFMAINWTPAVPILATLLNYTITQRLTSLNDGLVLDMPFSINSSTIAADYSGSNNNGVVSGAVWTSNGKYGGAYSFDGIDDTVNGTSAMANFTNTTSYTVSVWVKNVVPAPSANQYVISKRSGTGNGWAIAYLESGNIFAMITDTGSQVSTTIKENDVSNWHNVIGIYNSATCNASIYVDGVMGEHETVGCLPFHNTAPLLIGVQYGLTAYWNGTIDEVKVWNRALSADEVAKEYDNSFHYITNANSLSLGICANNLTTGVSVLRVEALDNNSASSFGESAVFTNNYADHIISLFTPINTTLNALQSTNVELKCNISKSSDTGLSVNFTGYYPVSPVYSQKSTQVITTNGVYSYTFEVDGILNTTNSSMCRQETATEATACGGLSTGGYGSKGTFESSYPASKAWDTNFTTFAYSTDSFSYIFVDYAIPSGVVGAILEYKMGVSSGANITNITIPSVCLSNNTLLKLNVTMRRASAPNGYSTLFCYQNTSGWTMITNMTGLGSPMFYEEAIWWNITTIITDVDWQGYANFTCAQESATCTEGNTISGTWQVYRDSIPPVLSIQTPTPDQVFANNTLPQTISFTYTASDTAVRDQCWYSLDGAATVQLPTCANFSLSIGSYGAHNITIGVNDTTNNIVQYTNDFEVGYLEAIQQSPADGYKAISPTLNYICEVNPAGYPLDMIWFDTYYTANGTLANRTTIDTSVSTIANYSISVPLVTQTNYTWFCAANTSTSSVISSNRTFTLDSTVPHVAILNPVMDATYTNNTALYNISFKYDAIDNILIDQCWYYLDGGSKVSIGGCQNITIDAITGLDHTLLLYANDTHGNTNSTTVSFSTATVTTTNLTSYYAINNPFQVSTSVDFDGETVSCMVAATNSSVITCTPASTTSTATISCSPAAFIDAAFDIWISCTRASGQVYNTSRHTVFIDTANPVIINQSFPGAGQSFRQRNITGQWNWSDTNLFRLNVTIDAVAIFEVKDINTTTYTYNLNRNVSNLAPGSHLLKLEMWDSHTAAAIDAYDVRRPILSNKLTFATGKNTISIDATDEGLNLFNPFTVEKEVDKYTFDYAPSKALDAYTFEVKTEQPIYIINKPNSRWKTWIVSGNNWIDFYMENSKDSTVTIKKVNDYTATVTISSAAIKEMDEPVLKFSSIGDLNMVQANYTFYTYNATIAYLAQVEESQTQSNLLLIEKGNASYAAYANFSYNGTKKGVTGTDNATYTTLFNSTFNTPLLPTGTPSATMSGVWTLDYNGEVTTYNISQLVKRVSIDNCSTYTNRALQIRIFDEDAPTSLLKGSMEAEISYWVSDNTVYKTLNVDMTGNSTYYICVENISTNLTGDIYLKYVVPAGFTHRYYAYKYNLSGGIQRNLSVYNFNLTTGISSLQVTAKDYYTNLYWADAVAKLQRYYVSEGVWRTVQMDKTDAFGLAVFHIREQTVDYRLIFTDTNNTVIKTTESVKFACTAAVCAPTILLTAPSATGVSTAINFSYTYNPASGQVIMGWNDPAAATSTVQLVAKKQTYTGTLYLCNTTQVGAAGTITCNTSGYTGEIFLDVKGNGVKMVQEYLSLNTTKLGDNVSGAEGAFWAVIIIVACIGFGLISPAIAIIAMFIGLIAIYFMGIFTPLTVTFLIVAAVLGIFIGFKVRS